MSGEAKSKIWTHIVSKMEGVQIYDEIFRMSDIEGGKIYYEDSGVGGWNARPKSLYEGWNDRITGTDKYGYETTVENIHSSVVVHEWYSHIKKGQGNTKQLKSHRLAYQNVLNFELLWNKTSEDYKQFNLMGLQEYTEKETKNKQVSPL